MGEQQKTYTVDRNRDRGYVVPLHQPDAHRAITRRARSTTDYSRDGDRARNLLADSFGYLLGRRPSHPGHACAGEGFAVTCSMAFITRAAASCSPRWSSSITTDQKAPIGLAQPLPMMSKAEP